MANKTKSASKPTHPLSSIRGAMGERKNWKPIHTAMELAKGSAPLRELDHLFSLARISPMAPVALAASASVVRPGSIQAIAPLDPTRINREIAWVSIVLSRSARLLNDYLPLRDCFFRHLVLGEYGRATLVLNQVDRLLGLTLWSIENRIALLTQEGGFENQRSYVSFLKSQFKRTFIAFYAANVSERNEIRVSAKGYERRLRDRAKTWNISDDQRSYILFKLLGQMPASTGAAAAILAFEASSGLIDLYETFVSILVGISGTGLTEPAPVVDALRRLSQVRDPNLQRLRSAYGDEEAFSVPTEEPTYLKQLLSGSYAAAKEELESHLEREPLDATALAASCALILFNCHPERLPGKILPSIQRLFIQLKIATGSATDPRDDLEKLARNFRHLPLSPTIALMAQMSENLFLLPIARESAVRGTPTSPLSLAELRAIGSKPAPPTVDNNGSTVAKQYIAVLNSGEIAIAGLSKEARQYALAAHHGLNGRPETALKCVQQLYESEYSLVREDAAIQEAWLLYRCGQVLESLEKTVGIVIAQPSSDRALPLSTIIRSRGFRELKQAQDRLILSIAFYQYSVLVDDGSKDVALKVAWKQFLKSRGLSRPSDLHAHAEDLSRRELVYFLRYVCVQEVMELGSAFSSPSDLDEERLQICLILRQIDGPNVQDYDAEILELTRRRSIEEGVRHVDSSRVYVDIVGIERWCQANLGESFLRYLDYAGAGLQSTINELEKRLVDILRSGKRLNELETFLDSYDISADSILQDIIEAAADAFMTLPRYGLDAFLGSRVRHGSLEGVFRSPLERLKLITKIDSQTNDYEENDYWLSSLQIVDKAKQHTISRTLKSLSRNVDGLIDSAVSRFVYVKSDANKEGLISLWKSDEMKRQFLLRWVIQAKLGLNAQSSLPLFINYCCYAFFWPALGASLDLVQRFCKDDLSQAIVDCLDTSEREISAVLPPARLTGFSARIRSAKTEVVEAANKLASWFHVPPEPSATSGYSLKTAIEVGMQSTRTIWRDFDIDVEWRVHDPANVQLVTGAFEIINDAAFLIFGNIAKHSGYFSQSKIPFERPHVVIEISSLSDSKIEVCVVSEIAVHVDVDAIRCRVNEAKATIASRRYEEVVARKRGTGLVRLASTLNHENNADKSLDFGVTEDLEFFVRFALPLYVLSGPIDGVK